MVFNVRSDGVVDGVYGITPDAPPSAENRKFVPEGKQLPESFFNGRAIKGVTVYVFNETERQFKPSLFYALLTRNDGVPQFDVRARSTRPVLDTSLAIR